MIKGQPSRTALLTAVQRAHHYHTVAEPKILRDNLALALTGLPDLAAAQAYIDNMIGAFAALSDTETAARFMRRIDEAVCLRSRVVEEELASAQDKGVEQLVILGAGLDSLAYRGGTLIEGLQVFEVDHPSTQAWKRDQLDKASIAVPDNMTFVPFDFENQTLAQALKAGNIDETKVTFFTWLGVHMYLTDEAVRATLSVMGQFAKGSQMVMDFISPSYVLAGGAAEKSVDDLRRIVSEMGEPMKSKYYEDELEALLKTAGFSEVRFLSAGWFIENYFGGQADVLDTPKEATSILTAVI